MLIVGENLKQLIKQHEIVGKAECYDNTCLSIRLGTSIIRCEPTETTKMLVYGDNIPTECLHEEVISGDGIVIPSKTAILASSAEVISMPLGYFGMLQTKGSLARMFVSLHFSDGQIDPGFTGNITFEIFNASCFDIKLYKKQKVGNLYIFKTSTKNHDPYRGRYFNAKGPTFQKPED